MVSLKSREGKRRKHELETSGGEDKKNVRSREKEKAIRIISYSFV